MPIRGIPMTPTTEGRELCIHCGLDRDRASSLSLCPGQSGTEARHVFLTPPAEEPSERERSQALTMLDRLVGFAERGVTNADQRGRLRIYADEIVKVLRAPAEDGGDGPSTSYRFSGECTDSPVDPGSERVVEEVETVARLHTREPSCDNCGSHVWYNAWVPDEDWAQIAPKPYNGADKLGGVLCVPCMDARCAVLGISPEVRFQYAGEVFDWGRASEDEGITEENAGERDTPLWKAIADGLNTLPDIDPYDDEEWLVGVAVRAIVEAYTGSERPEGDAEDYGRRWGPNWDRNHPEAVWDLCEEYAEGGLDTSEFVNRVHAAAASLAARLSCHAGGDGTWVHCSPALIAAGVSCARTPRRPCACGVGGSHDHFISCGPGPHDFSGGASTSPDGHSTLTCRRCGKQIPADVEVDPGPRRSTTAESSGAEDDEALGAAIELESWADWLERRHGGVQPGDFQVPVESMRRAAARLRQRDAREPGEPTYYMIGDGETEHYTADTLTEARELRDRLQRDAREDWAEEEGVDAAYVGPDYDIQPVWIGAPLTTTEDEEA